MSDKEIHGSVVSDIRTIWTSARATAVRSVNTELVKAFVLYPNLLGIHHAVRGESIPCILQPGLSWTHYRALMRVSDQSPIYTSRYQLHLPRLGLLRQELLREIKEIGGVE